MDQREDLYERRLVESKMRQAAERSYEEDRSKDMRALREAANASERAAEQLDNDAVDRFAAAMKAKLSKSRRHGRGGWHDPVQCPPGRLQVMLTMELMKGDPVDVGNFAMMLFSRGERAKAQLGPALPPGATDEFRRWAFAYYAPWAEDEEMVGSMFSRSDKEGVFVDPQIEAAWQGWSAAIRG